MRSLILPYLVPGFRIDEHGDIRPLLINRMPGVPTERYVDMLMLVTQRMPVPVIRFDISPLFAPLGFEPYSSN